MIPTVFQTREELRDALDNKIRTFVSDRDLAGNALIAWNHHEFEVQYQCVCSWRKKTPQTLQYVDRTSSSMTCTIDFC
jgi:hypothetical protein